jgi:hypothetical protein
MAVANFIAEEERISITRDGRRAFERGEMSEPGCGIHNFASGYGVGSM